MIVVVGRAGSVDGLLIAFTGLPLQADDVLLAIVIMQNGRVETGRCQIYRLASRTFNAL